MPQYRKVEALESMDRVEEETDLFDLDEECLNEIETELDKGNDVYIPLHNVDEVSEDKLIEPSQGTIADILAEVFEIQYITIYRRLDADGFWVEEESLS